MTDYLFPLVASRYDGLTVVLADLDAAADFFAHRVLGPYHYRDVFPVWGPDDVVYHQRLSPSTFTWILRDDAGQAVEQRDLAVQALTLGTRPKVERARRRRFAAKQKARAVELGIEVPVRDCWTSRRDGYKRHGRTRTEAKANAWLAADADELPVPVDKVGRRRGGLMVVPWDDPFFRKPQRSWKKHRRTRWK